MKKLLAMMVLAIAIACPANAALPDVYLSKYSASYTLKDHYVMVDEYLTFTNEGGPYRRELELERGDAWGIEVEGADFDLLQEDGSTVMVLKPYITLRKETIALHYSRADVLSKRGVVGVFNGSVIEGYPWYIFNIEVEFSLPEGHQSDLIFPREIPDYLDIEKSSTLERELITYNLNYLLPNKTLPIRFEYADYESLSLEKLSVSKTLIEEAQYDIKRAGEAIESARAFDLNVSSLVILHNSSSSLLQESEGYIEEAEREFALGKTDQNRYRYAYGNATKAESLARSSEKNAILALDTANARVQRLLKDRLSGFNEEVSRLEANLTSLEASLALKSQEIEEQLSIQAERIDEVMEFALLQKAAQRVTLGMVIALVVLLVGYLVIRGRLQRSVRWLTFKEEHGTAINESVVLVLFFIAGVFVMNAAFAEPLSEVGVLISQRTNEKMVKTSGYLQEADLDLSRYIDFGEEMKSYLLDTEDGEIYMVYQEGEVVGRRVIVTGVFFSTKVQFKDVSDTQMPVDAFIYATDVKPAHFWNEEGLSDASFYMILTYVIAALLAGVYDFRRKYVCKEEGLEGKPSKVSGILCRLKGLLGMKEKEAAPEIVVEGEGKKADAEGMDELGGTVDWSGEENAQEPRPEVVRKKKKGKK